MIGSSSSTSLPRSSTNVVVYPSFASAVVFAAVVSSAVVSAAVVSAAVVSCLDAVFPAHPVTAIIAPAKIAASHLLLFLIFMSPFSLLVLCASILLFPSICTAFRTRIKYALHHKLHNRAISSAKIYIYIVHIYLQTER